MSLEFRLDINEVLTWMVQAFKSRPLALYSMKNTEKGNPIGTLKSFFVLGIFFGSVYRNSSHKPDRLYLSFGRPRSENSANL